jgi:hypothetical protein
MAMVCNLTCFIKFWIWLVKTRNKIFNIKFFPKKNHYFYFTNVLKCLFICKSSQNYTQFYNLNSIFIELNKIVLHQTARSAMSDFFGGGFLNLLFLVLFIRLLLLNDSIIRWCFHTLLKWFNKNITDLCYYGNTALHVLYLKIFLLFGHPTRLSYIII